MKTRELTVTIADIALRLIIDEHFYDEAYQSFLRYLTDQAPRYTIWVTIAQNVIIDQSFGKGISVRGNVLMSASDEFFGKIDRVSGQGSITIRKQWAMGVLSNFLKNMVSYLVFVQHGLMLHASGLVREEEAYIFFGPSGIGKSTVAKVSSQCTILSDELIALVPRGNGFVAYGTPSWSEGIDEERKAINHGYPVRGLFKLVQDTDEYCKELCYSHAFADLFTVPEYCKEQGLTNTLMHSFSELVMTIPCYELHFLPQNSFWRCIDECCNVCA